MTYLQQQPLQHHLEHYRHQPMQHQHQHQHPLPPPPLQQYHQHPPLPPHALRQQQPPQQQQQQQQHRVYQKQVYPQKHQLHQTLHPNQFYQQQHHQPKSTDALSRHALQRKNKGETMAQTPPKTLDHPPHQPKAESLVGAEKTKADPQSSGDQTKKELIMMAQSHMEGQMRHPQDVLKTTGTPFRSDPHDEKVPDMHKHAAAASKSILDSQDDSDDYSDYSDEDLLPTNRGLALHSEMDDDGDSDYNSDSDHIQASEQSTKSHDRSSRPPEHGDTASSDMVHKNTAQAVQQELVQQLTMAAGAWSSQGDRQTFHSNGSPLSNNDSQTSPTTLATTLIVEQRTISRANQLIKAQTMPFVQEEGEEDEDDFDEEDSDEYDQEDEEDFSYSEEEGDDYDEDEEEEEEQESLTPYQQGPRQNPGGEATVKARQGISGHYPRSAYHYPRPLGLDENYLQKRAISKQVIRRSSLTALLGEASQPDSESSDGTIRPSAVAFGQYNHRHGGGGGGGGGTGNRRPPLADVWTGVNDMVSETRTRQHSPKAIKFSGVIGHALKDDNGSLAVDPQPGQQPGSNLQNGLSAVSATQEAHRPRRTDSGVEVKVPPLQHCNSTASDSSSDCGQVDPTQTLQGQVLSLPQSSADGVFTSTVGVSTSVPTRRSIVASASVSPSCGPFTATAGESQSPPSSRHCRLLATKPLKSSIRCHTFPRAIGKRTGQKHVSWHHSLFPTERVLHVKPSLPSLSSVAIESANATLSQLPCIPVMTRDKVESFHQSIRSLRTLSRIEIAKMSYKQQGRLELTSPLPISKSMHDSIPWWNPTRWFKRPVIIDKRHWKPDDSRESCAYCFESFHRLNNPRHHCRKCGDLFCGKCASAEILMDAKNCVYVQQSQLARWSRRVDLQRHSLWIDTLPELHPVRTAAESALVLGPDGLGSIGHSGGLGGGAALVHRSSAAASAAGNGGGSGRNSWQLAPGPGKKSRISIFGLFGNTAAPGSAAGSIASDSRRGSVDLSNGDGLYPGHVSAVTFSASRRPSSSSIFRGNTTASHLMMGSGSLASGEGGLPPIAMSRRMSSGGVGEVCLARICVGCERELLRPVSRCNSIVKTHGSFRGGYRSSIHGFSSLGPHGGGTGRQNTGPHAGVVPPSEDDPEQQAAQQGRGGDHHTVHGVRRHSPLRQTTHIATEDVNNNNNNNNHNVKEPHQSDHDGHHPTGGGPQGLNPPCQNQSYHQQYRGWKQCDDVALGSQAKYEQCGLTFQEQQLQYSQQALAPFYRELT